jgi:hypothetical protein
MQPWDMGRRTGNRVSLCLCIFPPSLQMCDGMNLKNLNQILTDT